jgi:hypothetical protein
MTNSFPRPLPPDAVVHTNGPWFVVRDRTCGAHLCSGNPNGVWSLVEWFRYAERAVRRCDEVAARAGHGEQLVAGGVERVVEIFQDRQKKEAN